MDAEHKEALVIIGRAVILLNDQLSELNKQMALTNEILREHGRLFENMPRRVQRMGMPG